MRLYAPASVAPEKATAILEAQRESALQRLRSTSDDDNRVVGASKQKENQNTFCMGQTLAA